MRKDRNFNVSDVSGFSVLPDTLLKLRFSLTRPVYCPSLYCGFIAEYNAVIRVNRLAGSYGRHKFLFTFSCEVETLLSLVLAYGNYMNGNTQRGQADGFQLDVLLKLRDVKAKDSDVTLLQYTVKQYLKQHEKSLEKNKGELRLPSPVSLANASQVVIYSDR